MVYRDQDNYIEPKVTPMFIYTTLEQAIKTTQRNKGTVWFGQLQGVSAQLFKLVPVKNSEPNWLAQKVNGEVYAIPEEAEIVWSDQMERLAGIYTASL